MWVKEGDVLRETETAEEGSNLEETEPQMGKSQTHWLLTEAPPTFLISEGL